MKNYHLDSQKFHNKVYNTIIIYFILSLVCLGVVYLNIGNALFNEAWMLIPLVFLAFTLAGWLSLRDRRRYWDEFEMIIQDNAITRHVPKLPDYTIKRTAIRGFKEVRQGIIIATDTSENALLISRDLADKDFQAIKRMLENWTAMRD